METEARTEGPVVGWSYPVVVSVGAGGFAPLFPFGEFLRGAEAPRFQGGVGGRDSKVKVPALSLQKTEGQGRGTRLPGKRTISTGF
jgi:hypothetical protein